MNWNVMLEVVMSLVFFAPLVILLGAFLFVGVLTAFEGVAALVRGEQAPVPAAPVANPEVGPIVAAFKGSIQEEARHANEKVENAPASKVGGA